MQPSSNNWSYLTAFKTAATQETNAWKNLGVERDSQFLVPTSGALLSQLSCRLHNPSFYVKDPYHQETADPTNPCINKS
jgi:hypothetical protein